MVVDGGIQQRHTFGDRLVERQLRRGVAGQNCSGVNEPYRLPEEEGLDESLVDVLSRTRGQVAVIGAAIINAVIGLSQPAARSPAAPLGLNGARRWRPDRCVDSVQRVPRPHWPLRHCVGVAGGLNVRVNSLWNAAACHDDRPTMPALYAEQGRRCRRNITGPRPQQVCRACSRVGGPQRGSSLDAAVASMSGL